MSGLNIHQKILKLVESAGVLQKTKEGFGYSYTPESDIQAKVTAGMIEYGLALYLRIMPGTFTVTPITYQKYDKKLKMDKTVSEVIVSAETMYAWVNTDNPTEAVELPWALVGQMEDAAQAFGAGLTYANRYFLLKSLQLATTEDDPDEYRSKQQEAMNYEEEKAARIAYEALSAAREEVKEAGNKLIKAGVSADEVRAIVSEFDNGNANPASISSVENCDAILKAMTEKLSAAKKKKKEK